MWPARSRPGTSPCRPATARRARPAPSAAHTGCAPTAAIGTKREIPTSPWPVKSTVRAATLTAARLAGYHLARGAVGERPGYRAAERSLVTLDPDTLVDVTSVAEAGYCTRKSLIEGLTRRGSTAVMAEGSSIHVAFARMCAARTAGP